MKKTKINNIFICEPPTFPCKECPFKVGEDCLAISIRNDILYKLNIILFEDQIHNYEYIEVKDD